MQSLRANAISVHRGKRFVYLAFALAACTAPREPQTGMSSLDTSCTGNPVYCENQLAGTMNWQITPASLAITADGQLEGYPSRVSVNKGEVIDLLVNTTAATYSFEVFRMGWYNGAGGRSVYTSPPNIPRRFQACSLATDGSYLVDCGWGGDLAGGTRIDTSNFTSGYFLVKLSATLPSVGLKQSYVVFVVRDDSRGAKFLMSSAMMTYHAYNYWGGYSFYTDPRATKVSSNRPYDSGNWGAGQLFMANPQWPGAFVDLDTKSNSWPGIGFEYPMVRYLEQNGYDVSYATDYDLHSSSTSMDNHNAFLSVGHDEYWSVPMYNHLIDARNRGKNAAFFSGNSVFWILKIDDTIPRIIETHKDSPDPWLWQNCGGSSPSGAPRCRDVVVDPTLSEQLLVGSITLEGFYDRGDFVIDQTAVGYDVLMNAMTSWVFAGARLQDGSRFPGIIGYETQIFRSDRQAPANHKILSHSAFKAHPSPTDTQCRNPILPTEPCFADMTLYHSTLGVPGEGCRALTAGVGSRGCVFSSGSPDWSLGLFGIYTSDFTPVYGTVYPALNQVTANLLAGFGDLPAPSALDMNNRYSLTVTPTGTTNQVAVTWTVPNGRPPYDGSPIHEPGGINPNHANDFVAVYQRGADDQTLVFIHGTPAVNGICFTQTPTPPPSCTFTVPGPGNYTAAYVTLDRKWWSDYQESLRTIWRGATADFSVP